MAADTLTYVGKRLGIGPKVVKRFTYTLASGNSYTNGGAVGVAGLTLAFNSAALSGKPARPRIPNGGASGTLPANTDIVVVNTPNGYIGQVEQNATNPTAANYVLRIFAAGSGAAVPAELASNTYATYAGLTGSTFEIEVTIPAKYN